MSEITQPMPPEVAHDAASTLTDADLSAGQHPTGSTPPGKPKRASVLQVFRAMPLLVKISALWLIWVVGLAIYAKLDTTFSTGRCRCRTPICS